jgi:hypothetical protein
MKKDIINAIIIAVCILTSQVGYAQEIRAISGKVTTFGEIPLNNVEITVSKSDLKTSSDSLGMFTINCSEKASLKFVAKGFDGMKLKAKKCDQSTIDLTYRNTESSFAYAISNNHVSKEILEMAMQKYPLKGEKDYGRYDNIYTLIDIEIYNVKVSGNSVTTIKPTSLSGSQEVLYVVDGTITSDVSFVLPMNVKTIRYVERAGAAKYGSQGGNGAIEITLK